MKSIEKSLLSSHLSKYTKEMIFNTVIVQNLRMSHRWKETWYQKSHGNEGWKSSEMWRKLLLKWSWVRGFSEDRFQTYANHFTLPLQVYCMKSFQKKSEEANLSVPLSRNSPSLMKVNLLESRIYIQSVFSAKLSCTNISHFFPAQCWENDIFLVL